MDRMMIDEVVRLPVEDESLPALITAAGPAAAFVRDEFFTAGIRNPHTRRAYAHAVHRFLAWAESQGCELACLTPGQVGGYLGGHLVSLRDRAVIAVLIYTTARIGAVAGSRRGNLSHDGSQWTLRFAEKRGKSREIPWRHDSQAMLIGYLEAAGLLAAGEDMPRPHGQAAHEGCRLAGTPVTAFLQGNGNYRFAEARRAARRRAAPGRAFRRPRHAALPPAAEAGDVKCSRADFYLINPKTINAPERPASGVLRSPRPYSVNEYCLRKPNKPP